MKKPTHGFTLIELLIVIVVIAILAAISVVAYTGIQNRAHDSAVQTDLRNIHQKLSQYQILAGTDSYPANDGPTLESLDIKVATASYSTAANTNLLYFVNENTYDAYALLAISKSGKTFVVSSSNGTVRQYDGSGNAVYPGGGFTAIANHLGIDRNFYAVYNSNNGDWRIWQ